MAVAVVEKPAAKQHMRNAKASGDDTAAAADASAAAAAAVSQKRKRKQSAEPGAQVGRESAGPSEKASAAEAGSAPDSAVGMKKQKQATSQQKAEKNTDTRSGAADTQTPADAATDEPAAHKKRRRKRQQDDTDAADASPEELARRAYQRERQELAKRLQAAGRQYKRQKPDKAKATKQGQAEPRGGSAGGAKGQPGGGGSGTGARGQGSREAPWETGDRPDHPVAVIIVPIFWLKREKEMREVLQAAAAIEKLLAAVGIDVGVDSSTPMSPGQKYRYWEMQGVKVRLEVGPKEAQEGGCIFSVTATPGEVATKSPLQVGQKLLDAVRKQLQLPPGDAAADAAVLRQHSAPSAAAGPSGDGGGGGGGPQLNIGRLSGNKGGNAGSRPTGKHIVFGGDDLDDDFQEQEAEPQPTAKAKKKRQAPPVDTPQPLPPVTSSKKAPKLVKF